MSATNLEIVTDAYLNLGVVDETRPPSAEQGQTGLRVLNDMLADMAMDGIRTGWFRQTDLSSPAPLQDEDIECVKYLLSAALAPKVGVDLSEDLKTHIALATAKMAKRYVEYFESDLTFLPQAQASGFGRGRW